MPQGGGTQFWDILISSIDYKNTSRDTQKMQQSHSIAPHEETACL